MSWCIHLTGVLSGVRAKVLADPNIPAGIKKTLIEIIDEPNPSADGISIRGSGHSGGGCGYVNELRTERVAILAAAPIPVPTQLPDAATTDPVPAGGFPEGNPLKVD